MPENYLKTQNDYSRLQKTPRRAFTRGKTLEFMVAVKGDFSIATKRPDSSLPSLQELMSSIEQEKRTLLVPPNSPPAGKRLKTAVGQTQLRKYLQKSDTQRELYIKNLLHSPAGKRIDSLSSTNSAVKRKLRSNYLVVIGNSSKTLDSKDVNRAKSFQRVVSLGQNTITVFQNSRVPDISEDLPLGSPGGAKKQKS